MKRDLRALADQSFDVLVIGAGIYGAAVAREAALRGLSVAVIDKGDFGAATSANSLKTIHGGLRYLQHADIKRMRESMTERKTLMRIAPHLVHPLPVLVPTYGHAVKGREAMWAAMLINDILSFDRNRGADPAKRIPRGHLLSHQEVLRIAPGLQPDGLNGGAVFYDAQVVNSERLTLAFIQTAMQAGAQAANYVEATGLARAAGRVVGAEVLDRLQGERFAIRARLMINTAGPWINRVFGWLDAPRDTTQLAKAFNVIIRQQLFDGYAVGISAPKTYHDSDALIKRGSRLLFFSPWRGQSMIGTEYSAYDGDPDAFAITADEIERFLYDVNQAYPQAALSPEDVTFVHGGLLPMSGQHPQSGDVRLTKHYRLDYAEMDGGAMLTVEGVKYTTARDVAVTVLNRAFQVWGKAAGGSPSAAVPLAGGEIADFGAFTQQAQQARPVGIDEAAMRSLVCNYGAHYPDVLRHLPDVAPAGQALAVAQTRYAVQQEMACTLSDVIFRRTELGSAGHPGTDTLRLCAQVMAEIHGWSETRTQQEIADVLARFPFSASSAAERGPERAVPSV